MAKQPQAGTSKTRLTPALSADAAAELADAFLRDAVEQVRAVRTRVGGLVGLIGTAPRGSTDFFRAIAPDFGFIEQVGASLSERLDCVLRSASLDGFDQVVAMNADSPSLPVDLLVDAFARLDDPGTDIVLGPADDGGYYLIGWKTPHRRIVRDVAMSTPTVFVDTLTIAAEESLVVAQLAPWFDVDEPADLDRLRLERAAGVPCGTWTAAILDTW